MANIISEKKFSISLDFTTRNSYIDYGPPDTTQMKVGLTPTYIPMLGTNYKWQNLVDGFYISSENVKYTTE